MDKDTLIRLGTTLADSLNAERLVPQKVYIETAEILSNGDPQARELLKRLWEDRASSAPVASGPSDPQGQAELILRAAEQSFGLTADNLTKINGGRAPERELMRTVLADSITRRKLHPQMLLHFLGHRTEKYGELLKDFMRLTISLRDEDPAEFIMYMGMYLLYNSAEQDNLAALNLASPLHSYITDRIGRVRSIYYASMLFMHSYVYILFAQAFEISAKFYQAAPDQRQKLQKLYSGPDRIAVLVNNAMTIASRKLAPFKLEAREVLTNFKNFSNAHRNMYGPDDLFGIDYRS